MSPSPKTVYVHLPVVCFLFLAAHCAAPREAPPPNRHPNIVLIMADDLGYGDLPALSPRSKIPTPHLDHLAAAGRVYTDAHSPSAVCTPTRYALLTGRYAWRTRLKSGVLWGESPPLLDAERETIATFLKARGYRTGCVGKWHLGLDYARDEEAQIDFTGRVGGGPVDHGFDEYFGIPASLDMPPYLYVRNDHVQTPPILDQSANGFPGFVRKGKRAPELAFDGVLGDLADEACGMVERFAGTGEPFFLYVPLTGPHKPVAPSAAYRGVSGLGPYGDFVCEVDATVGRILAALESAGVSDETLVVFTSDNGSFMYSFEDRSDHLDDPQIQGYRSEHHTPNGGLRGTKADIWEAGHRVPFIIRWPGRVPAASVSDSTLCLVDLFATFAGILGAEVGAHAAEDSFDLSSDFFGGTSVRGPVVHHSAGGMFALRSGAFKLVAGNGSGGREAPRGKPFERPYQLFDLSQDLAETTDLALTLTEKVSELEVELERIRNPLADH